MAPVPRDASRMENRLDFKHSYRRDLPHLVRYDRPLFLTFTTVERIILPPGARTIALRHALHEHGTKLLMDVAVVMPDHVHLIFQLLDDARGNASSLAKVMRGIKGTSARRINDLLGRQGQIWQHESFDHVVRLHERSRAKYEYVCENPVRAGLTASADEYPWLWRSWVEGHSMM